MKKHFLANLFIKCLSLFSAVMAQNPNSNYQIPTQFNHYHQNFPQEKVYLHLDKPFYGSGDNIWLSAYLFDGNSRFASPLSRTLYVELIDEFQNLAKRISLPLDSLGRGKGDFKLPDSIEGGNYRIRAYTNWMRNSNEAYFFDQTVPIYKTSAESVVIQPQYIFAKGEKNDTIKVFLSFKDVLEKSTANINFDYEFTQGKKFLAKSKQKTDNEGTATLDLLVPQETELKGSIFLHLKVAHNETSFKKIFSIPVNTQVDVQFFPEGGDLVAGLGSRVAFKATDEVGRGVNIKGTIFDASGKEIAALRSQYLGMGFSYFVPTNTQYEARIDLEDGKKIKIPLPKIRENAYVLRLDNGSNDKIRAYIFQNNPNPTDSLTLIGQVNHQIVYAATFLPSKDFTFNISKKDFPTGIVQFTLFDSQGKPQAERLIFSRKNNFLKIEVSPDKAVYRKREKAILNLNVSDPQGKPVEGTFSLAVTDSQIVQADSTISQSILSYMLINSDLRGFIEKPEYYFSQDKAADRHLDLLLMTQGWRRFEWKNVLELKEIKPAEFYVERGIVLSGSVKKILNNKPLENANVLFSHSNEKTGLQMQPSLSDQNGQYFFAENIFGEQTIFLQARNPKGGEFVKITLDSVSKPAVNERLTGIRPESMLDAMAFIKASRQQYQINQTFRFELDDQMLDEVTVRAKKIELKEEEVNKPLHGTPDNVIKMDDIGTGMTNVLQALQGRVPGLQISSDGAGGYTAMIRGVSSFMGSSEPLFLLDNMPVDASMISMIPPATVERVEILKGATAAIYGSRGANGVIAVYSKKGSEMPENQKPNVIKTKVQGFYEARQFYAPNYETPKIQHSKPDLRTTVFWNPLIKTDANGKAKVEFYNADNISNFGIIVEGTDGKGYLGRGTGTYKTVEGEK